jgi:protein-L-isoaspartate(D-aspartate) O-methyltransferase
MEPDWPALRERMVQDQFAARGIQNPRVLEALAKIPRHLFVPEPARSHAYEDRALAIGFDQTISQPCMVGIMLQALQLIGDETVLEIGTGSGYQAALLGELARNVDTVEIIPELAAQAKQLLKRLEYANVRVHAQDGSGGLPALGPYDAIVVAASAPDVPPPLLDQLTDHGKLLLPIRRGAYDVLTLIQKQGIAFVRQDLNECTFVPLLGQYGQSL